MMVTLACDQPGQHGDQVVSRGRSAWIGQRIRQDHRDQSTPLPVDL
jgi:hypothetical protein